MVSRLIFAVLASLAAIPALPAAAQVTPPGIGSDTMDQVQNLMRILQMDQVIDVMQAEGLDYGATLRTEMFPEKGGAGWSAAVATIYDPQRMTTEFETALAREMARTPEVFAEADRFFGDDRGQRIITLEIEARRALMDEATESLAREAADRLPTEQAARHEALKQFVAANDLIELNVMGALNANLAFYRGLAAGGAFGDAMTESDMLAEVWGQEADVRAETESWLWSYLGLAYQPLSDEDLQAYYDFSRSEAGRALNHAVFAAFDAVFVRISEDLGRAAARMMQGEDI